MWVVNLMMISFSSCPAIRFCLQPCCTPAEKSTSKTHFNCQTLFLDQNKAQLKIFQHFDDIHALSQQVREKKKLTERCILEVQA